MSEQIDIDGTGRREILKTVGVGTLTSGTLASLASGDDGVTDEGYACDGPYCDECSSCYYLSKERDSYAGSHTVKLVSALEPIASVWQDYEQSDGDGYWTHDMRVAGHAVGMENGNMVPELTSTNILLDSQSDRLNVFTSKSNNENGFYPEPRDIDDGGDAVDVVTGALALVAEYAGASFTSYALSATALAEGMVNGLTNFFNTSGDHYELAGEYAKGVEEASHHSFFYLKNWDRSVSRTMEVRSEAGLAINAWQVTSNDGVISTSSGSSLALQNPESMNESEREFFGVSEVTASEFNSQYGRDRLSEMGISSDTVYVADNPPVSVEPVSAKRQKELERKKRKQQKQK
jgi:hypothetical protein